MRRVSLNKYGQFLSSREKARVIRLEVDSVFDLGESVVFDFEGVSATQSFLDELIGVLVLKRGADLLKSTEFAHCSNDSKLILKYVVKSRLKDRSNGASVAA
ncbi:MAG: STAS-like domain-containing protein [Pseudomonadota bacterium]|nr:STAS-like domain-containing protein [Pseudomonadota bacterium]